MKTKLVEIKPPKIKLPPIKQTKKCSKCWKRKSITKFYTSIYNADWYRWACIECTSEDRRLYYIKTKLNETKEEKELKEAHRIFYYLKAISAWIVLLLSIGLCVGLLFIG